MTTIEYRKQKINFDETAEVWFVNFPDGRRVEDLSLKKLKSFVDQDLKGKFERIPVWVPGVYYSDEKEYEEAEITSVSPSGDVFFVRKGKNHAEKGNNFFDKTEENAVLISKIEKIKEELEELLKSKSELKDKLKRFDLPALKRKVNARITTYDVANYHENSY